MERHQMTGEQQQHLDQTLATLVENPDTMASLLRSCYGEADITVHRADEARGALHRLLWAIERRQAKRQHAGA